MSFAVRRAGWISGEEGEVFLVRIGVDASELEALPQKTERIAREMGKAFGDVTPYLKSLRGVREEVLAVVKGQKAIGVSAKQMAMELEAAGRTQEIAASIMREAGYNAKETADAFKGLQPPVDKTAGAFDRVGKAVKFAVFRFFTALIIYQALRKILRGINEAIREALRLWKEFAQAQQVLTAALKVNQLIMGEQVGTLREWNRWIVDAADAWNTTTKSVLDATNAALQANTTLRLSANELKNIVALGRGVAQMWDFYKDDQLDIAKGTDLVTGAIRGEQAAMLKLGVTQEDLNRYLGITTEEFEKLPRAIQEAARQAFIMEERFDAISEAAAEAAKTMPAMLASVDAAIEEETTKIGGFSAAITFWTKIVKLGFLGIMNALMDLAALSAFLPSWIPTFGILGQAVRGAGEILERYKASQEAATKATEEGGEAAEKAAKQWLYYSRALQNMLTFGERARGVIQSVTDKIREAIQPFRDLGSAIGDAVVDNLRAAEDAARDFARRLADLTRDMARDIARLNRRFEDRRAELIIRAEERIADIKDRFRKQEEEERDDLNMRLRHMEEDFLLDMKHLREDYELDIEEAARKRDWRAIRTLQRRYTLERRQRGEDYRLDRRQFIESWEARHKQRQKDLAEELKEVEDNLADQLAALERAKQRELDELKIRYEERRAETERQYAEQQEDLARALERRLADILVAAVTEGTIRQGEAERTSGVLAYWYGVDQQNLENMVNHDIEWLTAWAAAWNAALGIIADARRVVPTAGLGALIGLGGGIPSFAEGGTAIATKPTLVKVGERGPELFTAIPLARGGSVLGGVRNTMGGDFNLNIDGDQSALWSADFEAQVTNVVADMFREAFED